MRDMTAAVEAALQEDVVPYLIFVELDWPSGFVRLCNSYGNIDWDGKTWQGMGDLGRIDIIKEGAELQMYGVEMALSGVNTALAAAALGENYQGRSAKIWFAPLGENTVHSGSSVAGASQSLTLASSASLTDGAYNAKVLEISGGRRRIITAYGGQIATVHKRWPQNLIPHSDDLGNATWGKVGLNPTIANAISAYDGTVTASKLVEDANLNWHHNSRNFPDSPLLANTWYSFGCEVKAGERTTCALNFSGISGVWATPTTLHVNLLTGQVLTGPAAGDYQVIDLGGGWWWLELKAQSGATPPTGAGARLFLVSTGQYQGDGVSGLYARRFRMERTNEFLPHTDTPLTTGTTLDVPGAGMGYSVIDPFAVITSPVGPFKYRMDVGVITRGKNPTIVLTAESPLSDYDRPRTRRWTDEDHQAEHPGDTFFSRVPAVQELEILF